MPRKADTPCAGGCGKLLWRGSTSLPPGQMKCQPCRRDGSGRKAAPTVQCAQCGVAFLAKWRGDINDFTKCCSHRCSMQLRKLTRERICEICGETYEWRDFYQRTCGRECGTVLRLRTPRPRKVPYPATRIKYVACIECLGGMVVPADHRGSLCSDDCRRVRQKRAEAAIRKAKPPRPLVVVQCVGCQVEFAAKNSLQRYCDKSCQRRDGRHDRDRARKYGVAYEPVSRRRVYQRDAWRCGICGDAVDPQVAHPDDWSASLDHVIPMSLGGPHLYSNVQCSHLRCNVEKGATLLDAEAA